MLSGEESLCFFWILGLILPSICQRQPRQCEWNSWLKKFPMPPNSAFQFSAQTEHRARFRSLVQLKFIFTFSYLAWIADPTLSHMFWNSKVESVESTWSSNGTNQKYWLGQMQKQRHGSSEHVWLLTATGSTSSAATSSALSPVYNIESFGQLGTPHIWTKLERLQGKFGRWWGLLIHRCVKGVNQDSFPKPTNHQCLERLTVGVTKVRPMGAQDLRPWAQLCHRRFCSFWFTASMVRMVAFRNRRFEAFEACRAIRNYAIRWNWSRFPAESL